MNYKILFAKNCRELNNKLINPKDYPYWKELIESFMSDSYDIVFLETIIDHDKLLDYLNQFDCIVTIDSFIQHFCWFNKIRCIVIFSITDPLIFGHPENINLLKDRKYLSDNQFLIMEQQVYNPDAFIEVNKVKNAVEMFLRGEL